MQTDVAAHAEAALWFSACADAWGMPTELQLRFMRWSGSSRPEHHHYGDGGLVRHSHEVYRLMKRISETLGFAISDDTARLAAVFHDIGKLDAYEFCDGAWEKRVGARGHLLLSLEHWDTAPHIPVGCDTPQWHTVRGMIASHHGPVAWGSVQPPRTKEEWLLHTADYASARLDDLGGGKHSC